MVLNRRERGGRRELDDGEEHTSVLNKENEWKVSSLALIPLSTYIGNGYLQVAPWWDWISHDTTLATSWALFGRFGPYTSWSPPTVASQPLGYERYNMT